MAANAVELPPLPPGFALDPPEDTAQALPPLPPGFSLDQQEAPAQSLGGRIAQYGREYVQGLEQAGSALAQPTSDIPGVGTLEMLGSLATGAVSPIPAAFETAITGKPYTQAREGFTYQPKTQSGQAMLGAVGAAAKPVADVLQVAGGAIGKGAEAIGVDPEAAKQIGASAVDALGLATAARTLPGVRPPAKVPAVQATKRAAAPTTEELGTAARDAYARAKEAGAVAAPESYSRMATGLRTSLREQGFNPKLHPKAAAVIEEIDNTGAGKPVALDELEILRRQALAAERSIEADERRIAGLIIDRLDDYGDALASGAERTVAGNSAAAVSARKEARGFYARNRKSMEIRELIERAETQASQMSGSGKENALRTQFRQLAMNPKRLRRFTQEEQKAIKAVAVGDLTSNVLRQVGKLAPTGGLSQWLAIGGTLLNPAVAAVPLTGALARAGATKLTARAAQRAEELMRRGSGRSTEVEANNVAQLSPGDEIARSGAAFDAERAAAAQASAGSFEVGELPSESITLATPPSNRLRALAGVGEARSAPQIEAQMRALERHATALPNDSPELLELDARYEVLRDELARAKSKVKKRGNKIEQLSGGR